MRQISFGTACFLTLIAAAALSSTGMLQARPASAAFAQSNQQEKQTQNQKQAQKQKAKPQTAQPEQGYSSSSTSQAEASSPSDNPNVKPDPRMLDRYRAEQDIEVGTFYLHKGDPDAAISRLQEASRLRPHYGKPRLLLAECYEKKHDPENAVKYLKQYLQVYAHAPDAKKIQEKIKKLEKQEE